MYSIIDKIIIKIMMLSQEKRFSANINITAIIKKEKRNDWRKELLAR
ncbi:MAG: hypothetical protein PHP37_00840 [Patescibacteria group bacterium]|nr:hypothetical protein [Patescibacteria group bacterium]